MTTLTEHIIVAGAENPPPMLEKSMYDSWASRIRLFIKGKKNGKMMLDSIDNGLLGETMYEYYLRFSQMINDTYTIRMTMQQVQVNTKFLNALPLKCRKFVTDVKLVKSLYTTNYEQFLFMLLPRVGSTTLNDKVIVTLSSLKGQLRYISSGNSLSLAVAKYSSSRNFITSSGNALEHFISNNTPLNLMLHFQSSFHVGNKMHKAFPLPVIEFPLAEELPTASEER
nr:hypothetical protein [Tanacetum cinerariifolium]